MCVETVSKNDSKKLKIYMYWTLGKLHTCFHKFPPAILLNLNPTVSLSRMMNVRVILGCWSGCFLRTGSCCGCWVGGGNPVWFN